MATVGSCVLGLGVCMTSVLLVADGALVVAAAVLVTWVLHLAGWGKPPGVRPVGDWPMRARDHSARAGHPGCVGCRLAGGGGEGGGGGGKAGAVAGPGARSG
ncbi:hypothetical protein, partial [Streptomyces sp. NRRL WC-3618]|uniref:hypothetical protein n=1 Tax=Streptomyces sp. NRRL WC-3618 TaxID=1519490 RepID=UPI001F31D520